MVLFCRFPGAFLQRCSFGVSTRTGSCQALADDTSPGSVYDSLKGHQRLVVETCLVAQPWPLAVSSENSVLSRLQVILAGGNTALPACGREL